MKSLCPFGELCPCGLQVISKLGIYLGLGTDACDILQMIRKIQRAESGSHML